MFENYVGISHHLSTSTINISSNRTAMIFFISEHFTVYMYRANRVFRKIN